ncbi:hypothetical protein [Actinokineospora xionganensis]|uniref:Ig-like domain-containing protein n=1 Tax=Actinokineospora xionganensis TaxID=2684470 RepID=A0ABR7LFB1_9PSEU|nr:hypothetical protein [Actinokineospora xionganensis]MBC6451409.1 hypothetical protein [Actinokineospora xionganensis]
MGHIRATRLGFCAAVAAVGLVAGATPALASNPAGVAALGSAQFVKAGVTTSVPTLAQCAVDGQTTVTTPGVTASGVRWGTATSTCTTTVVDPDNDVTTTKSEALGGTFELSALVSAGGPRVKLTSYRVTCNATQGGTSASWSFAGMTGITGLPNPMPRGHVKNITKTGGTVLATATFNEITLPDPNDGSIALTMMRITFLPASGITGEVVVGRTACSPTP